MATNDLLQNQLLSLLEPTETVLKRQSIKQLFKMYFKIFMEPCAQIGGWIFTVVCPLSWLLAIRLNTRGVPEKIPKAAGFPGWVVGGAIGAGLAVVLLIAAVTLGILMRPFVALESALCSKKSAKKTTALDLDSSATPSNDRSAQPSATVPSTVSAIPNADQTAQIMRLVEAQKVEQMRKELGLSNTASSMMPAVTPGYNQSSLSTAQTTRLAQAQKVAQMRAELGLRPVG